MVILLIIAVVSIAHDDVQYSLIYGIRIVTLTKCQPSVIIILLVKFRYSFLLMNDAPDIHRGTSQLLHQIPLLVL